MIIPGIVTKTVGGGGVLSAAEAAIGVELRTPLPPELAVPGPVTLVVVSGTINPMANVQVNRSPEPFEIRRNDTLPPFQVDLYDESGDPIDLSAASSVVFTMRADDQTLKIDRVAASVVVGADGSTQHRLQYDWVTGDTDTNGRYAAEFEVSFAGGAKRTFPASRKAKLEVVVHGDVDAT